MTGGMIGAEMGTRIGRCINNHPRMFLAEVGDRASALPAYPAIQERSLC